MAAKRLIAPILFGLVGAGILVVLGGWQVQRLAWKEDVLARIEARIGGEAEPLPQMVSPSEQQYQPVVLTGEIGAGELHVLDSRKRVGAGYRIIAPFVTTDGRSVLIDRGFVRLESRGAMRPIGAAEVRGNLLWPDDRSSATPDNDVAGNIWFARDIGPMAEALGTEPLLVVVSSETPGAEGITPLPVDTAGIPNDHKQYAITWFSLAAIWILMTILYIRRTMTRGNESQ